MTEPTHQWDLTNVYPSLDSPEFDAAIALQVKQIADLEQLFTTRVSQTDIKTPLPVLAALVGEVVNLLNEAYTMVGTIQPYLTSFVATDSRNNFARRRLSEYEQVRVRLQNVSVQFQVWIGKLAPVLDALIAVNPTAQAHAFTLRETAEQSRYLMSSSEEILAAELSLSGGTAWGKLQGTITSQLSAEITLDGQVQRLPLSAIINLRSHPDEATRHRAYDLELNLVDSVREPLSACLNGVKGASAILNRRRGRQDALHSAIDQARIDRPTLEAMLGAMEASFPLFRRYFLAKAHRLGKNKLAWWDIFAPTGKVSRSYSFTDAREFILGNFASFSPDLADLAQRAFDQRWIDLEPRDGKQGGAFCMGVDLVKESRVLCNFDGSLDEVSTIAHELGHAYHNFCAYEAGKTPLQQNTPMTLAETASIMCETIVMQAVLKETTDPQEELAILEAMLIGDGQVIVDIYSRFLFEKEVFERREKAELSVDDLNEIMERAQQATYGDALDERYRNKYMWTWKPHYYEENLSFYNFPYSFGLLFGIGLYPIYQQRGASFVPEYKQLLALTGEASAADLAGRFGINIRQRKFWEDSLAVIGARIDRYCEI